eukprot:TRINITY_DN54078_c0_g1_i1.p1 TRINITY_DN54078_c0_g1~~TRINITY_DN54078_c0_g1_i1.p1  ORF type:complete len:222 (-),score=27.16 TRINITY_DN54078_c0_g1_i1:53-718(-)
MPVSVIAAYLSMRDRTSWGQRASAIVLGALALAALSSIASRALSVLLSRRRRLAFGGGDESSKPWQKVGRRSELRPGPAGWEALTFFDDEEGQDCCVLYRAAPSDEWLAFVRSCPHAGIDLLSGDVEDLSEWGAGVVVSCPAHAYLFDPVVGTCLWDASRGRPPETPALGTYEVREQAGEIWVRRKSPPAAISATDWDQARADALQLAAVDKALTRKFPDD